MSPETLNGSQTEETQKEIFTYLRKEFAERGIELPSDFPIIMAGTKLMILLFTEFPPRDFKQKDTTDKICIYFNPGLEFIEGAGWMSQGTRIEFQFKVGHNINPSDARFEALKDLQFKPEVLLDTAVLDALVLYFKTKTTAFELFEGHALLLPEAERIGD